MIISMEFEQRTEKESTTQVEERIMFESVSLNYCKMQVQGMRYVSSG